VSAVRHVNLPQSLSELAISELLTSVTVMAQQLDNYHVPKSLFDFLTRKDDSNYFRKTSGLGAHPFAAFLYSLNPFPNLHETLSDYAALGVALCLKIQGRGLDKFAAAIANFSTQFRLLHEKADADTINLLPMLSFDLYKDKKVIEEAIKADVGGLSSRLEPLRTLLNYYLHIRKVPRVFFEKSTILEVQSEYLQDGRRVEAYHEAPARSPKFSGVSVHEYAHDQPQAILFADVAEADAEEDLSACQSLMVKKDINMTNALVRRQVNSGADPRQRPLKLIKIVLENAFSKLNQVENVIGLLTSNPKDIKTLTKLEVTFQIVIAILTDRPLSWCRRTSIVPSKKHVKNGDIYTENHQFFLVYDPEIKTRYLLEKRLGRRKVKLEKILKASETDRFYMRLPDALNLICANYFNFIRPHLDKKGRDERISINSVLGKMTPARYRSLIPENIQNVLRRWLVSKGIDTVITAYICGDLPGMCAGLHYTQLLSGKIQNIYDQFLTEMGFKPTTNTPIPSRIVGSALVPKNKFISDRFCALKSALKSYSGVRLSTVEFQYHTYYTLYTYLILNMYAGHRAVGCPFEKVTDFNPEMDRLLISDEDVGDKLQPRVIGIGPTGVRQLKRYIDYLSSWGRKASVFSPEIASSVTKSLAGKAPLFFLQNEKWALVTLDPSNLRLYREFINPLPANWQRHWLRTELTGEVFGEDIDSFMGHTVYSRNPGNINAGSDFNYVSRIAEIVEEKLQFFGVKAL
jgi:hypothetical protein